MVFEDGIRRWDAVFFFVVLLVLSGAVWRWMVRDGAFRCCIMIEGERWRCRFPPLCGFFSVGDDFFPDLALCWSKIFADFPPLRRICRLETDIFLFFSSAFLFERKISAPLFQFSCLEAEKFAYSFKEDFKWDEKDQPVEAFSCLGAEVCEETCWDDNGTYSLLW